MAKVSAGKAAKMAGKSTPTITRAINSNKLSAERNPNGGWLIDVSELERVFGKLQLDSNETPKILQSETPNENSVLQVKLEAALEQIAEKDKQIEKAEEREAHWREQATRVTALIEDKRNESSSKEITPYKRRTFAQRVVAVFTGD